VKRDGNDQLPEGAFIVLLLALLIAIALALFGVHLASYFID